MREALDDLADTLPEEVRPAIRAAGALAIDAFLELEATLLEINPLFLLPEGTWIAGDVRLAGDENALPRQPWLAELLDRRGAAYPEARLKADHGFDLVVVDPEGEVGLVSTGAGLSMHLIDEMAALDLRAFNFCDIRSGGMHDDPTRLIEAFRRATAGPNVRCVLVSVFAGITELGHFAALLLKALDAMPEMRLPVVLRLVGNGQADAERVLAASGRSLTVEPRLEAALAACHRLCREAAGA
jgi:succinyl-CoA synthetase beta subunit